MRELIGTLWGLLRGHGLPALWFGAISLLTLLGALVLVPWVVVRIPSDYFAGIKRQPVVLTPEHPAMQAVLLAAKNVLGGVFLIAGTAMLFLPGQGMLTILVGIMLMSFPGKFRVERWIVLLPPVNRGINWIRAKAGREALRTNGNEGRDPAGTNGGSASRPGDTGSDMPGKTPC